MDRKTWLIIVVAILLLGGGGYGACVAMTDGGGDELSLDPATDPPGNEPILMPDGGHPEVEAPEMGTPDMPGDDPQMPEEFAGARQCGENTCAEGERCCHPTGTCYPIECQDCCEAERDPPTPDPRVTPDPGAGGPAGPQPPPIP
jgi:hypothetical protein